MPRYRFDQIAINSTEKRKPTESDMATYIGLEHMDSHSLTVKRWGSDVPIIGDKLVMRKGDVLLGKRNAYLRRAAIAPFDGLFSAHGMVLRPKTDVVDKDFFPIFIASDYFFDEAIRISVGSLSPTINWKDLKDVEFNLPTLDEQRKLAKILWAIIKTTNSYQEMLEKQDLLIKSQFIEMFGDSSSNVWRNISDVAEVLAGGDKPIDYSETKTPDYCYPVFANGIDNEGLQCFAKDYRVGESAVTISARGTIGATFIRKPFFTPIVRLITIIPGKKVDVTYLKYAIDSIGVSSNGSSQQQLTVPNVKKMVVPVPKISEQKKYTTFVEQIDKSKFMHNIATKGETYAYI